MAFATGVLFLSNNSAVHVTSEQFTMEYLFALGSAVVLTIVASNILSRLHPSTSSMDFPDTDAYLAHLKRRDRFVREEHVGFAAFNAFLAVALASKFGAPLWPTLALSVGFAGSWCLYRSLHRRSKPQMILWDMIDTKYLGLSLLVGTIAAVTTAMLLSVPVAVAIWPVSILVVCWLLLFPL